MKAHMINRTVCIKKTETKKVEKKHRMLKTVNGILGSKKMPKMYAYSGLYYSDIDSFINKLDTSNITDNRKKCEIIFTTHVNY
jgi:hypothetical protein